MNELQIDYKLIMSQIEELSEDDREEELELDINNYTEQHHRPKLLQKYVYYIAIVATLSVFAIIFVLSLFVATFHSENKPNITIHYNDQSIPPLTTTTSSPLTPINKNTPKVNLLEMKHIVFVIQLQMTSSKDLVQIQQANENHRIYQQTIREDNYNNAQRLLDDYRSQVIDEDSKIIFDQYIKALKFMALTTYPINHREVALQRLIKEERENYEGKYDGQLNTRKELNICVVTTLTRQGLQTGNYYYLLKSIYHQTYNNYKSIIINYPQIGMTDHINQILSLLDPSFKHTLFLNTNYNDSYNLGAALYTILHQYCPQTDLVIFLRDTGELIGKTVFKMLSKVHQLKQTNIVFTNYILSTNHLFSASEDDYKYKVQLYPKNLSNPRIQSYKTKYLKSYSSKLMMQLPQSIFQNVEGKWRSGIFQASMQFAALEANCGEYYLLEQITFLASLKDIQSSSEVANAQNHKPIKCRNSINSQSGLSKQQQTQLRDHP